MDLLKQLQAKAVAGSSELMDYKDREAFYKSVAWTKLSRAVKARDNFECQVCKDSGSVTRSNLITHHITPLSKAPDKALAKDNLLTVCISCHNSIHYSNVKAIKWDDERW